MADSAAVYLPGTHLSAHSKVSRHLLCTAQEPASTAQCSAAQLLLGGKPGQCTRMHSIRDAKCTASSVFARGSVQPSSHMTPWRQLEEKRHFARLLVQLPKTQLGLGDKVTASNGQLLLMQLRVSSTVSPSKSTCARSIGVSFPVTMQALLSFPAKRALSRETSLLLKSCFTGLQPSSLPPWIS